MGLLVQRKNIHIDHAILGGSDLDQDAPWKAKLKCRIAIPLLHKIVSRSVFYDETGKRVRTEKEITGEDGKIRPGCTVIKKGEVYEQHMFTPKDERFKDKGFLHNLKEIYQVSVAK